MSTLLTQLTYTKLALQVQANTAQMQEISRQLTNLTQALSQAPTAPALTAPAPTALAPIS